MRITALVATFFIAACGSEASLDTVDGEASQAVLNGTKVSAADFPSAVTMFGTFSTALGQEPSVQSENCSGVLIEPDVVLTAAHCVLTDPSEYGLGSFAGWFVTGDADISDQSKIPSDAIAVKAMVANPLYASTSDENDVGLLFLEHPSTQPAATLLQPEETSFLAYNTSLTVVGWGVNDQQNDFGVKESGAMRIAYVADHFVAGGNGPTQHCFGDSGGPLFLRVKTPAGVVERVAAVVHSGEGSDTDICQTSYEARVDVNRAFIDGALADANKPPLAKPSTLLAPHAATAIPPELGAFTDIAKTYCNQLASCGENVDVDFCVMDNVAVFLPQLRVDCPSSLNAENSVYVCAAEESCHTTTCTVSSTVISDLQTCGQPFTLAPTDGFETGDIIAPAVTKRAPSKPAPGFSCAASDASSTSMFALLVVVVALARRRHS